jgi:hypothetical protein
MPTIPVSFIHVINKITAPGIVLERQEQPTNSSFSKLILRKK